MMLNNIVIKLEWVAVGHKLCAEKIINSEQDAVEFVKGIICAIFPKATQQRRLDINLLYLK